MRYRLVVIGRSSRGTFAAPIERYLGRLRALAGDAELVELKEARGAVGEARREVESASLASAAQGRTIVLDERGTARTTEELARHVGELEGRGERRLSLLVGGADGTTAALREGADETWALSPLTLSHELALAVVVEQLYRVEALRAGHPYHRG
ncbi:23S rRNA (pseudouridine(1915)-N(3))-methyltransferase RlmH [soil metagenome]